LFGSHANFSGMLELESKICVDVQLTAADLDELWKNSPVKYLAWLLIVIGVGSSYMLVAELVRAQMNRTARRFCSTVTSDYLRQRRTLPPTDEHEC
jgi:hypothetical protein